MSSHATLNTHHLRVLIEATSTMLHHSLCTGGHFVGGGGHVVTGQGVDSSVVGHVGGGSVYGGM